MKNFREIFEAKNVEIEVDWVADDNEKTIKNIEKKYKVKVDLDTESMSNVDIATITGPKEQILKYLLNDYSMEQDEIEDLYPELF